MNTKIGDEIHNDLCVGIDLGTTNSVIAAVNVRRNGDIVSTVVNIPRNMDVHMGALGNARFTIGRAPLLPSCVYYREEDKYAPIVGDFAKSQYSVRTEFVAKSIKSQMGNKVAYGLSSDIPDKTPAQIASRILKHLICQTENIYRCNINDAVITVPANFDSVMCKATLDAAELAGIKVKNDDGSDREVLLSEPNAVIYDLINRVRNGEISNDVIDLSKMRNVIVFDLGGGTLDVTMHQIMRREDYPDVLKVTEIATNRYTLLGGDDFDSLIAEEMYKRYLSQYSSHKAIVTKIKKGQKDVMPQLLHYAEILKLDVSNRNSGVNVSDGWDDEDDDRMFTAGGSINSNGYSYDDSFSKEEVENILKPFMGLDLSFDDYKNLDKLDSGSSTKNIIYPILDVLKKASDKLGTDDVHVDALIVNGGMSKFYMITDRLRDFFGLEPIVALDPDQSVARGAAIYHYYLHKFQAMKKKNKEDIINDGKGEEPTPDKASSQKRDDSRVDMRIITDKPEIKIKPVEETVEEDAAVSGIQFGRNILNDSLYLGMRNGSVHMLIPTGAELPYDSKIQFGFKIIAGESDAEIPIKSQNISGEYRTIATGKINFEHAYNQGAYLSFMVHMNSSKVITLKAWTSSDEAGHKIIEKCTTEIIVGENTHRGRSSAKKILAPKGTVLNASNEVNNLKQLCGQYGKEKNDTKKNRLKIRIDTCVKLIKSAGNPQDFGECVLNTIATSKDLNLKGRLFVIATHMSPYWDEKHRNQLSKICMEQLAGELSGVKGNGFKTHVNAQAIRALGTCGNDEQIRRISVLNNDQSYYEACLCIHGKTGTDVEWIMEQLNVASHSVMNKTKSSRIGLTSKAAAMSFRKDRATSDNDRSDVKAAGLICDAIKSGNLTASELSDIILYLGVICDQRREAISPVDRHTADMAKSLICDIQAIYDESYVKECCSSMMLAEKLLDGDSLLSEEEEFLAAKLDK